MGKKRLLISVVIISVLFAMITILSEGFSAGKTAKEEWDGKKEVAAKALPSLSGAAVLSVLQEGAAQEEMADSEESQPLKILSLDLPENDGGEALAQRGENTDAPPSMQLQEMETPEEEEIPNRGEVSKEEMAKGEEVQEGEENPEKIAKGGETPKEEITKGEEVQREEAQKGEKTSAEETKGEESSEEIAKGEETPEEIAKGGEAQEEIAKGEETAPPVFEYEYAVAKVTEYVNIREGAGTEHALKGKLYRNSYAKIIERGEEWTKVTSGNVTGYIFNDYLSFDEEAVRALQKENALLAEVTAGTVNLRTGPSLDSEIIKEVKKGNTFLLEPAKCVPEWTAVIYEGEVAYLFSQFVSEKITFQTAISKEEEEKAAAEAAAKAAAEKSMLEAKKYTPAKTNRAAVELNDDDLFLLAIVVEMEAGSESYQGKLAVANVVINRLLSRKWGKTISSVVYAPNQFSGANSGRIEKFSTRVSADSKKAAVAAAAGENNIEDYLYFRMKSTATYSKYSKYYILGNHCFYMP